MADANTPSSRGSMAAFRLKNMPALWSPSVLLRKLCSFHFLSLSVDNAPNVRGCEDLHRMTFKMSDILSITLTATTSFIKKSTLIAVYIYLMCGATCVVYVLYTCTERKRDYNWLNSTFTGEMCHFLRKKPKSDQKERCLACERLLFFFNMDNN